MANNVTSNATPTVDLINGVTLKLHDSTHRGEQIVTANIDDLLIGAYVDFNGDPWHVAIEECMAERF